MGRTNVFDSVESFTIQQHEFNLPVDVLTCFDLVSHLTAPS
jgi:hypothetical protein